MSLLALAALAAMETAIQSPPDPFGPLPSARQLKWHAMEYYGFIHYTVNTYTDREWGFGDESPSIFNPTDFDADAIAKVFKAAGMKGLILVAKHHDGLCLWPTATTTHNLTFSPFKRDLVGEVASACRKNGLKFGVYLSPWDRNHPAYGTPAYVQTYRGQLRELLTRYGPLFEVWHDGANGGDGFYGGKRETRRIDPATYYDWPETWKMVRELQPDACIFSDVGPDIRWVGNESGYAAETSWATYTPIGPKSPELYGPGYVKNAQEGEGGHRNGRYWLPAECDVSIRPGWFWHEKENNRVKTPDQLMDLYFKSVGRGANFLLNVPPDKRGRIHENDERSLREFGRRLRETFALDYARGAIPTANGERGPRYAGKAAIDGKRETYWASGDFDKDPVLELALAKEVEFDVICLREPIALGQRTEEFAIEARFANGWREIAKGTSIGNCRLIRLPSPLRTKGVRLRILKAPVCPAISEFGLFRLAT